MVHQQRSVKHIKPSHQVLDEDGLIELSNDVLESIAGGKGAMAQDQIVQAEIAELQKNPNAVVIFDNNIPISSATTTSGIGSVKKH